VCVCVPVCGFAGGQANERLGGRWHALPGSIRDFEMWSFSSTVDISSSCGCHPSSPSPRHCVGTTTARDLTGARRPLPLPAVAVIEDDAENERVEVCWLTGRALSDVRAIPLGNPGVDACACAAAATDAAVICDGTAGGCDVDIACEPTGPCTSAGGTCAPAAAAIIACCHAAAGCCCADI
jgi:hypothetical protein